VRGAGLPATRCPAERPGAGRYWTTGLIVSAEGADTYDLSLPQVWCKCTQRPPQSGPCGGGVRNQSSPVATDRFVRPVTEYPVRTELFRLKKQELRLRRVGPVPRLDLAMRILQAPRRQPIRGQATVTGVASRGPGDPWVEEAISFSPKRVFVQGARGCSTPVPDSLAGGYHSGRPLLPGGTACPMGRARSRGPRQALQSLSRRLV